MWLRLVSLIFSVTSIAAAGAARAQAPILFPPEQFDAIDLVPNQIGGEGGGLLETLGAATDRFEPINGFSERNKYRVLGRAIGRLKILVTLPNGNRGVATCTTALIAPDRLITNYHCVPGLQGEKVEQVKVEFFYLDLGSNTIRAFAADPTPVEADRALDYAILKVFGEPSRVAGIQPLPLTARAVQNNESLFLIHHPAGQPQRLTRAFCRAHGDKALDGTVIRHLCDTLPGSSGALVFADDDFALVGIHHAGGLTPGDATSFNRGTDALALRKRSAVLSARAAPQAAKAKEETPRTAPLAAKDAVTAKLEAPPPAPKAAAAPPPPAPCAGVETAVGAEKKCLKPGDVFQDCPDCPEMVVVPAGEFSMGSEDGDSDEKPVRKVTIAKPFAVGKFEVTFSEWDACVAAGGCKTKPGDEGWERGRQPVMNVSWNDITKEYLPWLSKKTGKTYRLLSEAEWEYAARGGPEAKEGGRLRYWWGNEASHEHANFGKDECCGGLKQGKDQWEYTAPAGEFPANPFGLHDMHGNVWEWVEDCYHDSYKDAPTDGTARKTIGDCSGRVLRGGSWFGVPGIRRSAIRGTGGPGGRVRFDGFRLARTLTR